MWDLSGPLPTPKGDWLACPVCRGITVQARFWRFHERPKSPTVRWRCDVSFKCCDCAAVWVHGLALTDEAWEKRPWQKRAVNQIPWRDARRMIEGDQ